MLDNKTVEIFVSVAYKALMETKPNFTPAELEAHTKMLLDVSQKFGGHVEPFPTRPASAPRGTPLPGDNCPKCGTKMSDSKFKPGTGFCYNCWAKEKKN